MAMMSDERLNEMARMTWAPNWEIKIEAGELQGMVAELLTARVYIPKLQEVARTFEHRIEEIENQNTQLRQTASTYAEQQAKMIDEIRKLKAVLRHTRDDLRCLAAAGLPALEQK